MDAEKGAEVEAPSKRETSCGVAVMTRDGGAW